MSDFPTKPMGDIPMGFHAESRERSAQVIQIESSKLLLPVLLLSLLACILSGFGLAVALWSKAEASRAQTRADLLQIEVESFKNVLHAARLPTTAHLPGESP